MSRSIRVLIADASATFRRTVTEMLQRCPDLEVAGVACDGNEALVLIAQERPDVIVLDLEMPVMDGIDVLSQIRRTDRRTPVLMLSSPTVTGAEATLDALALGANDYILKPSNARNIQQAIRYIETGLVPRIRHWGAGTVNPGPVVADKNGARPLPAAPADGNAPNPIDVVAIGASTGGPNALADIVAKLPADFGVSVLIVQHMSAVFTKLLAERLNRVSLLSVVEGCDGTVIRSGQVLVAPGDYHMTVRSVGMERRLALNQGPPEESCRPAVDVLFRSVGDVYGGRSLAVVLTGMGKDGLEGCRSLRQHGAVVVAQDEPSSVVWGMPRAVTEAGLADRVLPLGEISAEIIRHGQFGRKIPAPVMS